MKKYSVEEIVEKAENLSYMPVVVVELMEMVTGPNIEVHDIICTIQKDQGLVARVFKFANSSFYGRIRKAENLSDAVITLGLRGLKSLVISQAVKHVLTTMDDEANYLWEHAVKVSIASTVIAKELRLTDMIDDAIVGGLMHDIGKAFIGSVYPEVLPIINKKIGEDCASSINAERSILCFDHTEVGARVAEKWNFPQKLTDVIRYHHYPDSLKDVPAETPELIDIVKLANIISHSPNDDLTDTGCFTGVFKLSPECFKSLVEDIKSEWEKEDNRYF